MSRPGRSRAVLVCALVLLCGGVLPARAWGPAGHRITAAVADELLTPRTRAAVAAYLEDDRDRSDAPSHRATLAAVAVWADEIRGTPADHPTWHFDDMPVCGELPSYRTWCAGGDCATGAIERMSEVLRDSWRPLRERNEALKWIVHLAGDLHQPLHAADHDDRGGGDITVALAGRRTAGRQTLHRVWDGELVGSALAIDPSGGAPFAIVRKMVGAARALPADTLAADPETWAYESNRLARDVAYAFPGFECDRSSGEAGGASGIVVLDERYQRRAEAVIRKRLVLGGARLAAYLNQLLDPMGSQSGARREQP